MPGNFRNEDIRITKTQKSLMESLPKLLRRRNFTKITVNDLCEEAQISRVAFYSHYKDKFDLLQSWMASLKPIILNINDDYAAMESTVNGFVNENTKLITHLLTDANNETAELLRRFIFSLFEVEEERDERGKHTQRYIVLSNFYSGGLLNLLYWQVRNDFPQEIPMFNPHVYKIITTLFDIDK